MKRTIWLWQLIGFAITAFCGTLLHFLYEWTGKSILAAPFSGVNESTWEHMKLFFWPALLFAIIQGFFFSRYDSFWCVKTKGILIGLGAIPVLFYTYNGTIGKSPDFVNIAIFFISTLLAYCYEARALKRDKSGCNPRLAKTVLFILAAAFIIFTFVTPRLNIFLDPESGIYGTS